MLTKQVWKIGDSKVLIKDIPNDSINFIITDPPYGINKDGILNDSDLSEYYSILPDCYRVLKNDSFFVTFASIGRLPDFFLNNPFKYRWQYILYINNGMVRGSIGFNRYISILIFQKGDAKTRIPLLDIMEVSTCSQDCNDRLHPTEKRLDVTEKLILGLSKEGDFILDPFLGGGTTLRACRDTDRNGIGFELNPLYEFAIKERLMADTPSLETWADKEVVA